MPFFGSSWKDDEDESLNDARVRRYQEERPIVYSDPSNTIRRIVEYYVKGAHDRLELKTLKKLVDRELVRLKKKNII